MLKKRLIPTPLGYRNGAKRPEGPRPKPVLKWRHAFFAWFLIKLLWYKFFAALIAPAGPGGKYTPAFIAVYTRIAMERLGGMWIKAAQVLAMRRDLVSKDMSDELGRLHDSAHGFPGEIASKIVEQELGASIQTVFSEFDPVPIAAASVGQVHIARLRENGVKVAVKVQRPTIIDSFGRDLKILRTYLNILQLVRFMPWARWDEMYVMLQQILADEVDYRLEVASMRRMRRANGNDKIYIPKAFTRYCKKRIIVMEYIDGVMMSDFLHTLSEKPELVRSWCKENNISPEKVGKRLFLSVMKQTFEDNLVHGDLHPGNIMFLKNSRLALLDFGTVASMDVGFLEKYNLGMKAMLQRKFGKYVDIFLTMTPGLPNIDIDTMKTEMVRELEAWEGLSDVKGIPYDQRAMTGLNVRFTAIMGKYKFPPFWGMLRLSRTMSALDGSLQFLLPEINFFKLSWRHYRDNRERMLKQITSKRRRDELVGTINELMQLPAKLSENIIFQAEVIRKRALSFQAQISKAAEVGKVVVTTLLNIGLLVTVFMIARYLNKQTAVGKDVIADLPVRDIFAMMPHLSGGMWLVVIVLSFYLLRNLGKLVKILAFRGVPTNPFQGGGP